MRAEDFDIQKIIDTLQGSCTETIQSALDYHYPEMQEEDLTQDDLTSLDNEVMNCPSCGWWCEASTFQMSNESGEEVCEDCYSEQNPDEEE